VDCPDENRIVEYLQDLLPAAHRTELEAHIDGCAGCLALVAEVIRGQASRAARELDPGTHVEHFQIMRLIGRGAMGEVYLGRDTRLGRRVALKIIRPDRLGSSTATERFLFEARTTARFNHPHIVTVYSVGEWRGMPYLALEYLEGETLRQRLDEERQGMQESIRVGLAVAEALSEAHRGNVLHRDLKPANVMLPRDGRLRVLDFGLAKALPNRRLGLLDTLDVDSASFDEAASMEIQVSRNGWVMGRGERRDASRRGWIRGTPAYMAPEQWSGAECTPATDLWALGVLLHEMLGGHHPYEGVPMSALRDLVTSADPMPAPAGSEPLPEPLTDLVRRCLAKNPAERPTATQACDALEALLAPRREHKADLESPYRGLLPFSERHAGLFFGREAEVAAFLELMREQAVMPVVGPSGAGKTSFVQAGVLPRLRERASWLALQLRPGSRPFANLASRLLRGETLTRSASSGVAGLSGELPTPERSEQDIDALARELADSPLRLNLALRQLADSHRSRVLLFVDGLEELCTMVADASERAAFMEAICNAGDEAGDPVRVIFTLRDDFLGRLPLTSRVRELLGQLTLIHAPEPEDLQQTLVGPLSAVGFRFDDEELPQRMVRAVCGEPAALALLQFTAQSLWDRRDRERRLLLASAYEAIGGVAGALARHADRVLEGLPDPEVSLARRLLLRLVTPDGTRRTMGRSALLADLPREAEEVLERLIQGRLLSVRKGLAGEPLAPEEPQLELAHESLIASWARLSRWIDEGREELAFLAEVEQAAGIWDRRGRPEEEVWRGRALQEALLRAERSPELPERAAAFLEAAKQKEERQHRRRRRQLVAAGVALAIVAVVSVVVAMTLARKSREAAAQRDLARARQAAAQREGVLGALAQGDLLQAWSKLRSSLETEDSPLARALWTRLARRQDLWSHQLGGNVYAAAFSPDGRQVAAACQDKSIYIFDARTARYRVLRGHDDQVFAAAFSPDGTRLASGAWDGEVRLWELRTGAVKLLPGHKAAVWRVTFSSDGRRLASASWDRTARLWDLAGARSVRVLRGHEDRVYGVAFSPDGETLATAGADRKLLLWSTSSGKLLRTLLGHEKRVYEVSWSPDGDTLASAGLDRTIRLWDPRSGKPRRTIRGPSSGVYGLAFSPDGEALASSGWTGHGVALVPLSARGRPARLGAHDERVYSVAFSPDGKALASGGSDKTLRLWRVGATPPDRELPPHHGVTWGVAFSPDGQTIASGGLDRTVRLWDVRRGAVRRILRAHDDLVTGITFSPDGKTLATASADRSVILWDVALGEPRVRLANHKAAVYGVAVSPDGSTVATGGSDRTLRLWSTATGGARQALEGHGGVIWSVAYSPDGAFLATASADRTVRVWRTQPEVRQHQVLEGPGGTVYGVAFAPSGDRLAAGGADGVIHVWPFDRRGAGQARKLRTAPGRPYYLGFDPSGQRLAVPLSSGQVRVFDLKHGSHRDLSGHGGEVNTARFSPDGAQLATTGDDGTVRLWDIATGEPRWRTVVALHQPPRAGGRGEAPPRAGAERPTSLQTLTHLGWWPAQLEADWARGLSRRARRAAVSDDGDWLCVLTSDRQLSLSRLSSDRRLFSEALGQAGTVELLALPRVCVANVAGRLRFYSAEGAYREAHRDVAALDTDGAGGVLVATRGGEVLALAPDGERRQVYRTGVGVTAMARDRAWLALGFREGNIELRPLAGGHKAPQQAQQAAAGQGQGGGAGRGVPSPRRPIKKKDFPFEGVPSVAVTALRFGPPGTLAAGFADGSWGLWSSQNGRQLLGGRLHGPVLPLRLVKDRLLVVTALGQQRVVDLSAFRRPYCQLLREVWSRAPTVWEHGLPVLRPPPEGHRCR
jgi:WD40 repeat protein/serine/threonine protein kinase